MTFARDLARALEPTLGSSDETIHTAVPPLDLGGGADVITFPRSPIGVVYVTAGLRAQRRSELVLCTGEPAAWAPSFLSRVGAASLQRDFCAHGTTPLGDADAPFDGLLFAVLPQLAWLEVAGQYTSFLLCVGITRAELHACRSHGTPWIVALLERAGVFPRSVPRRADVPGLDALGPSPFERTGLSDKARRGLNAVVNVLVQEVENSRARFTPADLEILASIYPTLGTWEQRCAMVYLIQDSDAPCLAAMRHALLREALQRPLRFQDAGHDGLAAALAGLEGDADQYDVYWRDLDAAREAARARLG